MKLKNAGVLLLLLLILITFGIGMTDIYTTYFYHPLGDLRSVWVRRPPEIAAQPVDTWLPQDQEFLRKLEQWAKEHSATIFLQTNAWMSTQFATNSGRCVIAYSDWLKEKTGIDCRFTAETEGAYVVNDRAVLDAYVSDNLLLPNLCGMVILGTYERGELPDAIGEYNDFFCPLHYAKYAEGFYLTDAEDIDSFLALCMDSGYTDSSVTDKADVTLLNLIPTMLRSDSVEEPAKLYAMLALMYSFLFISVTAYRDRAKNIRLHHLFGLPRRRLRWISTGISAVLAAVAVTVSMWIAKHARTYLPTYDLRRLAAAMVTGIALLTVCGTLLGWFATEKSFGREVE